MSSTPPAIRVSHLSKKYTLGGPQEPYHTFRDAIVNSLKAPMKIFHREPPTEGFWALKDVSFEVGQGEVVGIIGRNGAGKSTLLKILSRITAPTEGTVEIHGRVGSLLEVGTGFHPELTGRENIYLSGSILGMKRREIDAKLDDIVKFSEIEKFLDTPVKRYSSGMYVRLAFAVAAHLEPEILLVDEVLAVGDAAFQKKCLGKMGDVAKEGRTVLFVSHNINAIEQLCNRCVLMENGKIKLMGLDVQKIIGGYLHTYEGGLFSAAWENKGNEFENPWFKPLKICISNLMGEQLENPINNNQDVWIQIEGMFYKTDPAFELGYSLTTEDGIVVYWSFFADQMMNNWPILSRGKYQFKSKIPRRLLNEGGYKIELYSCLRCREWLLEPGKNVPTISLIIKGGLSDSPYFTQKRLGVIAPILEWNGELI